MATNDDDDDDGKKVWANAPAKEMKWKEMGEKNERKIYLLILHKNSI